jgi:hypothetical protein
MKLVILNVLSMVITLSAHARTPIAYFQYDMDTLKIDGELVIDEPNMITEGKLVIDFLQKEIRAFAQQTPDCAPDKICPKYLISLMSASAKIVNIEQNTCSTVYTAEDNKMPVDGQNIKIVVETYEYSKCMFIVQPITTAVITVQGYNKFEGPQIYETTYEMTF